MDGMIKAHCMGTEFPKRDTDSPNVTWKSPKALTAAEIIAIAREFYGFHSVDLDAVAEEQRVKEKTSAEIPNR